MSRRSRLCAVFPIVVLALVCLNCAIQTRVLPLEPGVLQSAVAIKSLLRDPAYAGVEISPTGDYVAVAAPVGGEPALIIMRRENLEVTTYFQFTPGEFVRGFFWVKPDRIVVATEKKTPAYLPFAFSLGRLLTIRADGSGSRQLVGERTDFRLVHALPDAPDEVLIEQYSGQRRPSLFRVNVESGSRRRVAHERMPDGSRLLTDETGAIRFRRTFEPGGVEYSYRDDDGSWTVLSELLDLRRGTELSPISIRAGEDRFLALYREPGRTRCLVEVDLNAPAVREVLCDARVDIRDDDLVYGPQGEVVAVSYVREKPVFQVIHETGRQLGLEALGRSFAGEHIDVTSYTSDGSMALLSVTGDRRPTRFYLFDAVAKRATFFLASRPDLDPSEMAESRPIEVLARDGRLLPGYFTLPADRPARSLPMIVLPHGGPHDVRDSYLFDTESQLFASYGYAVLRINFRGSGGYGDEFESSGYGRWGRQMQDDITDATRWAVEEGLADPDRICIYGSSYGAYAALMGAVREPELYKCAAGNAGVYDLPSIFTEPNTANSPYLQAYFGRVLGTDMGDLADRSPTNHADKIRAALFFAHGKQDDIAPWSHLESMLDGLDQVGHPYEVLFLSGEGHGFFDLDRRVRYYEHLLSFFERNIGASPEREALEARSDERSRGATGTEDPHPRP